MVKIIEVSDIKAPDNQAIIQAKTPTGMIDIYQGSKDVLIFHVSKKSMDDDEYWIIGETLSTCYTGKDFEERLKRAIPQLKIQHGR
jgi:hypothetical protein